MNARLLAIAALSAFAAAPALAQNPQCATAPAGDPQNVAGDACQKAIDLFQYMAPQLGTSLTGGSSVLGQGGTLGGLGHFALDIRANGLQGSLPQVNASGNAPQPGAPRQTAYTTKDQPIGLPAVNLAIGLFKGIPLGLTNVGGVDLLLTGTYIPSISTSDVTVNVPNGSTKIGYGARIGLLQESLIVPGVSLSYMKKDLPVVDITAQTTSNSSTGGFPTTTTTNLNVNALTEKTTAIRVMASKSLLLFSLSAGVGQDKYESSTSVNAQIHSVTTTPAGNLTQDGTRNVDIAQNITRTIYFGGVGVNLFLFKLVAEVGMVSGGSVPTYNTFDKAADASRLYGSAGLRFGF